MSIQLSVLDGALDAFAENHPKYINNLMLTTLLNKTPSELHEILNTSTNMGGYLGELVAYVESFQ